MKKPTFLKMAAALAAFSLALPLQADEKSGVSCATGTEATFSGGVLKCKRSRQILRDSVCSPVAFSAKGITVSANIVMDPSGSDQCQVVGGGAKVPSVMVPGLGDPPVSAFQRVVNATGPDKFQATQVSFEYPEKLPPYIGDASRGVKCPSGFETDQVNGNRGIRCEDRVVKKAICDGGFTIDRNQGKDRCVGKDLLGNTVIGQFTIPENSGFLGIMGNPDRNGWSLDTDRQGNIDFWIKDKKDHKFPNAI